MSTNLKSNITVIQDKALKLIEPFIPITGTIIREKQSGVTERLKYRIVPIDRATMDKLVSLKVSADILLSDDGKKDSFYYTMKLLRPECTIYKFKKEVKHKYQLITDKIKVIKYLDGEVERRKNLLIKRDEEWIKQNNFDKDMITKIRTQLDIQIDEAKQTITDIKNNPNEYDILITSFEDELSYPSIYINFYEQDGKRNRHSEHLRIDDTPVVFVYEPEDEEKYRNNAKIKNLKAKGGKYLLGTILYKKK